MRCQDVMKREVVFLGEQHTLQDAAAKMRDKNVGFLPVCDARGKVLGTLTDRDIVVRAYAYALPAATPVTEIMSMGIVGCHPDDSIEMVEELMVRFKKSRIVVMDDDGILLGVVSLSDVADKVSPRETQSTIRGVTDRRPRYAGHH
jgi:CBS domain-containing protein